MADRPRCEPCRLSGSLCDLQRPTCTECYARGIECVYHNDKAMNFTFVDQNDVAAVASRRAAARRSRGQKVIELDASLLEGVQHGRGPQMQQLQLVTPMQFTLDNRVLQRFVARWSAGLTALGCLESAEAISASSAKDSAIRSAILATAYADLAVSERHGDHGTASHRAYFGTLRRLKHELTIPGFAASNDVLAAVLTIDAYEVRRCSSSRFQLSNSHPALVPGKE